jgi:hypothetical protein
MLKVFYKNDPTQICVIRPTPFVQISENVLKNKEGTFGITYTITLTGSLLANHGTPYAIDPATNEPFGFLPGQGDAPSFTGPYNQFDSVPFSQRFKPPVQQHGSKSASAILSKQRALRALFAQDGQRVEITDILDNTGATIACYPRTTSVDFTEGPYINKCEYTIVLETDYLLRGNFDPQAQLLDYESTFANSGLRGTDIEIIDFLQNKDTAFIETYSEDWSLEADDQTGESLENPITYRISHSLSATGKTVYGPILDQPPQYNHLTSPTQKLNVPAWEQAKRFVQQKLSNGGSGILYPNIFGQIGSGTVNLVNSYGGYNHVRTEQINVTEGTYSVSENWILSSGKANETYTLSTSTSNTDPFITVQIDGNIKGLRNFSPSGFGNTDIASVSGAYFNALQKYNQISNSGRFGLTSDIYKRANNLVAVELNSQPVSMSLSSNQYTGDITYNLNFNNRPTNIISGVIAESIQINDTYPGDVFAVIQ